MASLKDLSHSCIIDYVEESARQRPYAIALVEHSTGRRFTFLELDSLASKLAKVLKKTIVYPDELITGEETPLVSFLTERGLVSIVCILAILKAGAAYVPVDNSFPEDRQEYIFAHSQCQLVILDKVNEHRLPGIQAAVPLTKVLVMNNQTGEVDDENERDSDERVTTVSNLRSHPDFAEKSLAYVLYTSGSTGKPKGVMVKNKGLLNVALFFVDLLQMNERTQVGDADRVLGLTTLCFDISMLEVFMPLLSGATLVLVNSVVQKNPLKILDVITKERISIMQATPTTYEMLIGCGWAGDRNIQFLVGGEACRPKILALAQQCGARFYNVYGPTETSIWSSSYLLPTTADSSASSSAESLNISVGRPLWKTQFYVVDEKTGEDITGTHGEGELWIGGDGVALGYLHAPDLTEKRFFKNPWAPGMVYRTGDLFKMREEDDNFIFVRRMDDQVKIKGYRIELAEVELAISAHPAVEQAVVIVKDDALWGFVKILSTSSEGEALRKVDVKTLTKTLQDFARKKLPPYMIPKLVVPMDSFPTTANGKLDRLTLSKTDLTVYMLGGRSGGGGAVTEGDGKEKELELVRVSSHPGSAAAAPDRIAEEDASLSLSMVKFVKAQVSKISGQSPSAQSSFAAVGIDSLAAMMFRNLLSQSLGGAKIDPEVLYDPETTIESFSRNLYTQLQEENPSILLKLGITRAVEDDLEEGGKGAKEGEEGLNAGKAGADSLLAKALLIKRNWIEGLRGVCMCLVILDHFFFHSQIGGDRLHADTVLFLAISGMTMGLQDLAQYEMLLSSSSSPTDDSVTGNRKKFQWDFWSFLHSRFVGLFPLLWLVLILAIPSLYLLYYTYHLTTSQFVGMMILYVLGLQTWTQFSNTALHSVYYVSLIWSVFVMYGLFKTAILSERLSNPMKSLVCAGLVAFLVGMYLYHPGGGFHPPLGFCYFVGGFLSAVVYRYLLNKLLPLTEPSSPTTTAPAPGDETTAATTATTTTTNPWKQLFWNYFPSFFTDVSAFFLFFAIFYNYVPKTDPATDSAFTSPDDDEVKIQSASYHKYDNFMLLVGVPVIFCLMMIGGFLQTKAFSRYSLMSQITQSYPLVLIGECSLPIYIVQLLFMQYFAWIVAGIDHHTFPFTRTFILHRDATFTSRHVGYTVLGVFLFLALGVFMQKVYQDRFITALHLRVMNYLAEWKNRRSNSYSSSSAAAGKAGSGVDSRVVIPVSMVSNEA